MARPPRQRIIAGQPPVTVYKPAGVPARELQWTTLTLDEFEAVRLVDGEGLGQEAAAARMGVSRPTVSRILAAARAKVARVLASGQAMIIQGGPVVRVPGGFGMGFGGPFGRGRGRGPWGGGRGRGRRGHRRGRTDAGP
jgi:predicted DNA-binding protein (UPF0251 family)